MRSDASPIALFIPTLGGGGAEHSLVRLAGAFADRGHRVHLVAASAAGPLAARVPAAVTLIDLGARRLLTSLPALVRYLRRERPRALLARIHYANVLAVWAARLARVGTRVVATQDNTLSMVTRRRVLPRDRYASFFARRAYPGAGAVVAISRGVADDLVAETGVPRELVTVIPNAVVTPELARLAEVPTGHPWLADAAADPTGSDSASAPDARRPVILGCGRLEPQKDFATLIRAFALLRSSGRVPEPRLIILGEGGLRGELSELAAQAALADDVSLPGFVDNPFAYMRRASVFVLSSEWEGFGNVLVEAMACGCPVVSTDCPSGPAEILEGGRHGRLVPVGDAEAMARAIAAALDEPATAARADALRARAADFSMDRIPDAYLEVMRVRS